MAIKRVIVGVSLVLLAGMGLFPPWQSFSSSRFSVIRDAGYAFLFSPPSWYSDSYVQIDFRRLIVQW